MALGDLDGRSVSEEDGDGEGFTRDESEPTGEDEAVGAGAPGPLGSCGEENVAEDRMGLAEAGKASAGVGTETIDPFAIGGTGMDEDIAAERECAGDRLRAGVMESEVAVEGAVFGRRGEEILTDGEAAGAEDEIAPIVDVTGAVADGFVLVELGVNETVQLIFELEHCIEAAAGSTSSGREADRAIFGGDELDVAPLISERADRASAEDMAQGKVRLRITLEVGIEAGKVGVVAGPSAQVEVLPVRRSSGGRGGLGG